MRLRNVTAIAAMVSLLAAVGCSRLTFVKPKFKNEYRRTAPEYTLREDPKDARRIALLDRVGLAERSLAAGRLDEAEAQARAALKIDAKSGDAYTLLGMIEGRRGNSALAGASFAKAAAVAPTRGVILNNYGAWLCGNGQAAASLPLFDRALADPAYPTPAEVLSNAGSCALMAGQPARAQRDLGRALELDPTSAVALAAMAENEFRAGRFLQARAFSERRLDVAPPSVEVLQLASQIEQKLGDTVAAARYVQRIGTEFPQTPAVPSGDASQP
jgi:type IV pilus assembly protein PilF